MLAEDDFTAEWDAIESAAVLRGDVCYETPDDWFSSGCLATPPPVTARPSSKSCRVSFAPYVQIFVGNADDLVMKSFELAVERLTSWTGKPWQLESDATAELCAVGALQPLTWPDSSFDSLPGFSAQFHFEPQKRFDSPDKPDAPFAVDDCYSWVKDIVNIFRVDTTIAPSLPGPPLAFSTWFVNGTTHRSCHSPQTIRLGPDPAQWFAAICELWRDQLDLGLGVHVGLVRPAPPLVGDKNCLGHLLVHQATEGEAACLFSTVCHGDLELPLAHVAAVCSADLTMDSVLHLSPGLVLQHVHLCDPVVQTSQLQVQASDPPFYVDDYDFVQLYVEVSQEENDVTSFMATGPQVHDLGPAPPRLVDDARIAEQDEAPPDPEDLSPEDDGVSSTASDSTGRPPRAWYPVTVFSLGQAVGEGQANWQHHNVYRMNIARIMGLRDADILQLYHVRWPPSNLRSAGRQAIIVQKPGELPIGSNHKYVLIDVEFHPHRPSTVVEIVRAPYLVPDAFTRSNLLDFLGLSPFCRLSRDRCLVWRNGQLVALQDLSQMHFEHGDFLRVVVPPTPELLRCVPTRAAARCAQLGVPLLHIPHYYLQHDMAIDLNDMPIGDALVDEMALSQLSVQVHGGPPPVACRVDHDPPDVTRPSTVCEAPRITTRRATAPVAIDFEIEVLHRSHARTSSGQPGRLPRLTTWFNDHVRWPICADSHMAAAGSGCYLACPTSAFMV